MGLRELAEQTLGVFWDGQKYESGWHDALHQTSSSTLVRKNLAYKKGYEDGLASRLLSTQTGKGGYRCTYCQKGIVPQLPGHCDTCNKYLSRVLD